MTAQPADPDAERVTLAQSLWTVLGLYEFSVPGHPPVGQRRVLDTTRGAILYTHHGHHYRVTLTVTAEED